MKKNNYNLLLKELKKGKTLNLIANENNICRKNLKHMLFKRFGSIINTYVYGNIILNINGFDYYDLPKNQTNGNECNITKDAKTFLINKFDGIEEVGIWLNNYSTRYAIDIYSKK